MKTIFTITILINTGIILMRNGDPVSWLNVFLIIGCSFWWGWRARYERWQIKGW